MILDFIIEELFIFYLQKNFHTAFLSFLFPMAQEINQLFDIETCKGKPDFHGHFCFPCLPGISHRMMFLCCTKNPFYGFFSFAVDIFHSQCMSDILTGIQIFLPYMSCYYFDMALALCTLGQIRTAGTYVSVTLVFSVTLSVCRGIF